VGVVNNIKLTIYGGQPSIIAAGGSSSLNSIGNSHFKTLALFQYFVGGLVLSVVEVASPLEHHLEIIDDRMRISGVLFLKTRIGFESQFLSSKIAKIQLSIELVLKI
jgi:hypothetical protein